MLSGLRYEKDRAYQNYNFILHIENKRIVWIIGCYFEDKNMITIPDEVQEVAEVGAEVRASGGTCHCLGGLLTLTHWPLPLVLPAFPFLKTFHF